jgi:hypothetical protein
MIRYLLIRILFFLFAWSLGGAAFADDILVVVSKTSTIEKLSTKQLENIYRRKTFITDEGTRWNPINLISDHPLRIAFTKRIFQQPPDVIEAYWNVQYFQGIMPPYVVNSVEAMLRFVENTPGAIGYLLPCQIDNRVRIVLKLTVNDSLSYLCNK